MDTEGKYKGPAADIPGSKKGGTITVLQDGDFEHLDPQQIYVSNALSYGQLIHRALVGYIESPKAGEPLKVVGDLATNSGITTDGGKSWTFTLRDGIKFEDGSPITSKDVAYGVARSFGPQGTQGPQYLQTALDPKFGKDGGYAGPEGGDLKVPGVETPDAKTIKFTFKEPHPELPFLAAFQTTTPVQQSKDTHEKYDNRPESTGPYKVAEHVADTRWVLERNPNWDPASDPIRHAFVDKVVIDLTADPKSQTERLTAANGADAAAVMVDNVPPPSIPPVKANAEVMKRVVSGPNQYVYVLNINTQRVTDVDVRRALNYLHDRDAYIKAAGGYDIGSPSTSLSGPQVPGWKKYDAYPSQPGDHGDVEKAKKLLEGKTVPKLTLCTSNTAANQTIAAVFQQSFKRGGIDITIRLIDRAAYYTTIGKKSTDCDLMSSAWGPDWSDQDSTLGVLYDGTKIVAEGNQNYSYFDQPDINGKLKALRNELDRVKAADKYGDLDEEIMTKYAPSIPLRYGRNFSIYGPSIKGTFVNQFSQFDILGAWVES